MLGVNFIPHQNWVYPGSNNAAALGSSQGPVGPKQHSHTIMCCEVFKRCHLKSAKIMPLSKPAPLHGRMRDSCSVSGSGEEGMGGQG